MNPFLADKNEVVKYMRSKFSIGDQVPGWACVASLDIIKRSAKQLVEMADRNDEMLEKMKQYFSQMKSNNSKQGYLQAVLHSYTHRLK